MFRSAYTILVLSLFIITLGSPVLADKGDDESLALFFDPATENEVTGPPPNYQIMDATYFYGAPRFDIIDQYDISGYHVYFDTASELWTVNAIVYPGGQVYEQIHGSVLIQLDNGATPEMVVNPIGFEVTDDLAKNDRWGYIKYPETIAPNLYEIWWDITVDIARIENESDYHDTIGVAFSGCAFDFNLWASGHFAPFDADQLYIGKRRVPMSYIPDYVDTHEGIIDESQEATIDGTNTSLFTASDLAGATFDANGLIVADREFSGSYAYEGNGIQFSVAACPANANTAPYFYWPDGTMEIVSFCSPEPIYDTIKILDGDEGDVLTLTKISGPGIMETVTGSSPVRGYYSWTPTEAGTFVVVFEATDTQGHVVLDSTTYIVTLDNNPPIANDLDTTLADCNNQVATCIFVDAYDPDGSALTYTLIGDKTYVTIDEDTGELCFETYVSGTYTYEVEVSDNCAADTATITFHITTNYNPYIQTYDSTIYLCEADTICFDVNAIDPDAEDSLEITQLSGPGVFTPTGNGTGTTCFMPDNVDSARYIFTYQVTDDCLRGDLASKCPKDSIVITVLIGTKPQIACPEEPQVFSLCNPDSICVPIPVLPSDAVVTIIEGDAVYENGELCIYADQAGVFDYTLVVDGECGADTCTVTFDISMGEPPQIACPTEDIDVTLCAPDSICIDIPVTPSGAQITILEQGCNYNSDQLCFYPEQSGTYTFTVVAAGECGSDTCVVTFNVSIGTPPVITCPESPISVDLCNADSVCVDIPVSPLDATIVVLEEGAIFENGKLCFYAEQSGSYTFTVVASNECGSDTCVVEFNVSMGQAPELTCPDNQTIHLCEPGTVSVPIGVIPPSADVFIIPQSDYTNGILTFDADTAGVYCFNVTATTECGETECDFCITVTIDSAPIVTIEGGEVFLCEPQEVCLPVSYSDIDGNIVSIEVTPGGSDVVNGYLCFTPETSGTYEFIVTVTDECGNVGVDTAEAVVALNEEPTVAVGDTSVFLCEPTEICLPVEALDLDGTISSIEVTPPAYYNSDNQTVCVMVEQSGDYTLSVTVTDDCGIIATSSGTISAELNSGPFVTAPADTTIAACTPQEICLSGFDYGDVDGNLMSITFFPDLGTFDNGTYCFTPVNEGETCIIATVTDECGLVAVDTFCVAYTVGEEVAISCPEIQFRDICNPGNVCVAIPVVPSDAVITILEEGGTYTNGEFCYYAESSGQYTFTMIADGECGTDTCEVVFNVTVGSPPTITCPTPEPIHLCGPDSISVPLSIIPPDVEVTIQPEAVLANGMLTFYAPAADDYCFEIIATTECGADTCHFCVPVTFDAPPVVDIADTSVYLCDLEEICIPFTYDDSDNNVASISVIPETYVIADNNICFIPTGEGQYEITVTVTDDCGNESSSSSIVTVGLNQDPLVNIEDTTVFVCYETSICMPLTFSDPDGLIDSITVAPPAYIDSAMANVCLPVSEAGEYTVTITVYDDCGSAVTDNAIITATANTAPIVALGDYTSAYCELEQVCIPVSVTDVDGNAVSVTAQGDCGTVVFNENDSLLCFTPTAFGTCLLTVIAADDCGGADTVSQDITITQSDSPNAQCPGDTTIYLCETGQLCLEFGDLVLGTNFRFVPETIVYYPGQNQICYFVTGDQVDTITVIDSTDCGLDSCSFVVSAQINAAPTVAAEEPQEVAFCDSTMICVEVSISDPDNNIAVVTLDSDCPDAFYDPANSQVCIPVTEELHCTLGIIVVDSCNAANRIDLPINAVPNTPPVINPPVIETVVQCYTEVEQVVIPNICVTDEDYDEVVLVLDSGLGELSYDDTWNCGTLTFTPPNSDSAEYCFRFMAYDACDTVYETFCITYIPTLVCGTCIDVFIAGPSQCVYNGNFTTVQIIVEAEEEVAGYDLLMTYDPTALTFGSASMGSVIEEWEYFTYRLGNDGSCGGCPDGLIRLVAIADVNNGPYHPSEDQYLPSGEIASMQFLVTSDVNFGGHNIPLSFLWNDCGDNTFSDPTGQYLYIDKMIFNREGNILWDESDDDNYPESGRPNFLGAPDECLITDKEPPIRCADFHNGEICIIHPDSIDARGDLNLNGVANEISDAVVYTNFFIYGLPAFHISVPGQIAASDVNADGIPLTVADLVLLVRIITGDATPIPKPSTAELALSVKSRQKENGATLEVSSMSSIGAALFVYKYEGESIDKIQLGDAAEGMNVMHLVRDNELRILLYSFVEGRMIPAGDNILCTIQIPEGEKLELIQAEAADYYAHNMTVSVSNRAIPNQLMLSQNYPNPFNPTTTFMLSLPVASDYHIVIYNVMGQSIRTWDGKAEAGDMSITWDGTDESGNRVASGIYFYKAQAAGSEAIRKMVLLK